MRAVCLIAVIFLYSSIGYSQTKVDSLIQEFLIENHEIDSIIFKEKKRKKITTIESNHFSTKELEATISTKQISVYTFGSYSAHADRFVLLELFTKSTGIYSYVFLGKDGMERDLKKLLDFFEDNADVVANDKKKMIQILLTAY